MSEIPIKTYPSECLHAMIADHEAEQAGAASEASSAVETKEDAMSEDLVNLAQRWPEACWHQQTKGDAMSEQAHDTIETEANVTVSDQKGVLMRICRDGLWVNPDIPADECAQHMLASLHPLLSHTINTEVNIQVARLAAERDAARAEVERLTAERDEAQAEVERLRANGQGMFDSSRPSDEEVWREAFITMLPSYPWEKAAKQSDGVLAEYRKRWPR